MADVIARASYYSVSFVKRNHKGISLRNELLPFHFYVLLRICKTMYAKKRKGLIET